MTTDSIDEQLDNAIEIDERLDALIAEARHLISSYHREDCSYYFRRNFPARGQIRSIFSDIHMRTRLFERVKYAPQRQQPKMRQLFFRLMYEADIYKYPDRFSGLPPERAEEMFQDALAKTWEYFIENFDNYDPALASPMTRFDNRLKGAITDVFRSIRRGERLTGTLQDNFQQDSNDSQISTDMLARSYEYLRDNRRSLERQQMSRYPQVDCYFLLNQRLPVQDTHSNEFLEGKDWDEILEQLELDSDLRQELSRFYRRQCLPCLKRFLRNEGYY
jgi:hypothetical protein